MAEGAFGDLGVIGSDTTNTWVRNLQAKVQDGTLDPGSGQTAPEVSRNGAEAELVPASEAKQSNGRSFYKVAGIAVIGIAAFVAIRAAAQNWDAIKAVGNQAYAQGKVYANKAVAYAKESRVGQYVGSGTAKKVKDAIPSIPTNKPICTRPFIIQPASRMLTRVDVMRMRGYIGRR